MKRIKFLEDRFPGFRWDIVGDKFVGISDFFKIEISESTCMKCKTRIFLIHSFFRKTQIYEADPDNIELATAQIKIYIERLKTGLESDFNTT